MVPIIESERVRSLLLLLVILGGYLVFFGIGMLGLQQEYCVFKSIAGIPCPGCGMGRATNALLQGDFFDAFLLHPLSIPFNIIILITLLWITLDVIRNKYTLLPLLKKRFSRPWIVFSVMFVALLWLFNIVRGI